MRRPSLLAQFGLISFVVIAALGVALGFALREVAIDRAADDARRTATAAAQLGVLPLLDPATFPVNFAPLPVDERTAFQQQLASGTSLAGVTRVKVWNRQHWIVLSDNDALTGRWFPGTDLLEDAFMGRPGSEVTSLSNPEEMEERDLGTALSVYFPLGIDVVDGTEQFTLDGSGDIVGAFEIYLPKQPIDAGIARDTRRLVAQLAIGLGVLYVVLFRLVAAASRRIRRQASENEHLALFDSLTGLPNRHLFSDRVTQAITAANRSSTRVAVLLLDLDRFKVINDTLGHRLGDQVLQLVGERVSGRLRRVDSVARLGGDEFAVLLSEVSHDNDPVAVAEELAALLEEPITIGGLDLEVHGSIGVAVFPTDGQDAGTLLQRADVAMYTAKAAHSRVERYRPERDSYAAEKLAVATDVRRALDADELLLHYQPKIDLRTGRVHSVEALIRWQHPTRGFLGPGAFMDVVETTELIVPLTNRVLGIAARQAAHWTRAGLDITVAVNLSARSVLDNDLAESLTALCQQTGITPERLEVELTETALVDNPDKAALVLGQVRAAGFAVSLDDFGTGYASLGYLAALPLSTLKIDRSFVCTALSDPQSAALIEFTVQLAHQLGLSVVAEGVEEVAEAELLTRLGCDEGQGFLWAKPMAADVCTTWIEERNSTAHDAGLDAGIDAKERA
ncbi:MAG: putative bifunctional diguanylate cyclase/phosphodiesterase [Acidimicrobiia bacterium]